MASARTSEGVLGGSIRIRDRWLRKACRMTSAVGSGKLDPGVVLTERRKIHRTAIGGWQRIDLACGPYPIGTGQALPIFLTESVYRLALVKITSDIRHPLEIGVSSILEHSVVVALRNIRQDDILAAQPLKLAEQPGNLRIGAGKLRDLGPGCAQPVVIGILYAKLTLRLLTPLL